MDVLLEEWSPVCSIQAVVEDNGQAVYFYLWVNPGSENAEIRNCWICNRRSEERRVGKECTS